MSQNTPDKEPDDDGVGPLDDYEPTPEDIEELRRRIQNVREGKTIPFEDYVKQARERRKQEENPSKP